MADAEQAATVHGSASCTEPASAPAGATAEAASAGTDRAALADANAATRNLPLPSVGAPVVAAFRIDDDDSPGEMTVLGEGRRQAQGDDASPSSFGAMAVGRDEDQEELASSVREKFKYLNPDDQKTVCRRECQVAEKRENVLMQQLRCTIDSYVDALEVSRLQVDSAEGPVLPPEIVTKYEERLRLLRGTIAALEAEPTVNLPKLTPLENAKGFVFSSYAGLRGRGDSAGASAPVQAAAAGARRAFGNISGWLKGDSSGRHRDGSSQSFSEEREVERSEPAIHGGY